MPYIVHSRWVNGYTIHNVSDDHELIADQKTSIGGNGLGVRPVQMLLASLASCRLMCAAGYAKKHGLRVLSMDADASCDVEEMKKSGKANFHCALKIRGALSESERESLIAYVNQACTVGKMLSAANDSTYELIYEEMPSLES